MTHGGDVGYELQTRLLVDAANGLPIAPLSQTLTDRAGCRSTLTEGLSESLTHMDALTADIARVESLATGKKLVHLIDREGDSIGHMRTLSSQGICWLIRGKEGHRAEWGGDTRKIGEIADDLPFIANGQVGWKGKKANMEIGETSVIITRTAKAKRKDKTPDVFASRNNRPVWGAVVTSSDLFNKAIDGFTTIIASGTGFLNIGSYVHIGGYTFLSAGAGIIIKDFCGLSQGVKIYSKSDDYSGKKLTNPTISEEYTGVIKGTVTLEKHVIIGSGTVVLPNITLKEGVSFGAQSLVTKDLNEWGMYFGCPAKKLEIEKAFVE
uniref:Acyltransferase n=1 Tax=Rhodnius prolixus TaxID=13249 RepID=T1HJU9_RHOPR